MPNLKSAKKALRQSKKRRALNLSYKKAIKIAEKSGDLKKIYKALDKATKRGVLKKNKAARKKSQAARLSQSLANNQSSKAENK